MAQRETLFKTWFVKQLKLPAHLVWKMHGNAFSVAGMPDLYILPKGGIWVELKTADTSLRPLQRTMIKRLKENNIKACVVRGFKPDGKRWTFEVLDEEGEHDPACAQFLATLMD